MKKKVLALTGIRSEYDIMYPLLSALHAAADFELGVIVSGAHLSPIHRYSVNEIEKDGFLIAGRIDNLLWSDHKRAKVKSTGILIQGLAEVLDRENPDFLLVLGDREEVIAGAVAGTYLGIPVVHIAGGDCTHPVDGDVDDSIRHATSKLSHIHLTMHQAHSDRLIRMGEEEWRVHTVGNGGLDRIRQDPGLTKEELIEHLGPEISQSYVVWIYHALSSAIDRCSEDVDTALQVIKELEIPVFIGAPNSDPGFRKIQEVIEKYSGLPRFHVYHHLPRRAFISLLRHAACLVGNSSLGILEAPFLGLPAVNIGQRQSGRLTGGNVQFVNPVKDEIREAIQRAIGDAEYRDKIQANKHIYGDGFMAERSIQILRNLPDRKKLLAKTMY